MLVGNSGATPPNDKRAEESSKRPEQAYYESHDSTSPETEMIFGDPDVMEVMKGRMHDLPVLPSNIVRIFLSSTFSGENHLLKFVFSILL
jgi:hypothetical protein